MRKGNDRLCIYVHVPEALAASVSLQEVRVQLWLAIVCAGARHRVLNVLIARSGSTC